MILMGTNTLVRFLVAECNDKSEDELRALLFLQQTLGPEAQTVLKLDAAGTLAFHEQFGEFWSDLRLQPIDAGKWMVTEAISGDDITDAQRQQIRRVFNNKRSSSSPAAPAPALVVEQQSASQPDTATTAALEPPTGAASTPTTTRKESSEA